MSTIAHWISGSTANGTSSRTAPVFDPATGQEQATVLLAEQADVDAAVAAARKGFEEWRDVSLTRRARVMFAFRELVDRHTNELARIVASEHGKVVSDAKGEVIRGMEVVEYACGLPELLKGNTDQVSTDVDLFSFRQPLGVCAGITPFNFPVMVPMWMHPMAIACGNAFVLKPSERDPSASNFIAQLYADAGLPDGVFNASTETRSPWTLSSTTPTSTPSPSLGPRRSRSTSMTGRPRAGSVSRLSAVPRTTRSSCPTPTSTSGQPPDRGGIRLRRSALHGHLFAVAVGDVAEPLLERLEAKVREIKVGPGLDKSSDMGPVITAASRDRIRTLIGSGATPVPLSSSTAATLSSTGTRMGSLSGPR